MSELIENKIKQQDVVGIDLNEGANKEIVSSAKNSFLYFFEILASFLIVFIHCSFPGDFGIIIKSFARFGVPLFFAISGFFLFKENATAKEIRTKIKKRASRISVLLLISFLIYLILGIITSVIGENPVGIINYLKNTFSVRKIALLFICNDPLTHFINWFMIAQLFSYLIIYLFPNLFFKNKIVPYIISAFTLFWVVFRLFALVRGVEIFGIQLDSDYLYRSWYATGLPFICLGIIIHKNFFKIQKVPLSILILFLVASATYMVLDEYFLIKRFGNGLSYNFGAIGCVVAIFGLSIKKPFIFSKFKLLSIKGNWISFVYILHPAMIILTSLLFDKINFVSVASEWLQPLIVLCLTIFIAMLINFLNNKRKKCNL